MASYYDSGRYYDSHNLNRRVDRQEHLIDRMSDRVRKSSYSNSYVRESLKLKNQQIYNELQNKVEAKNKVIKHLEKELNSWQKVVNDVYRKYSNLRASDVKKEYSIGRLQNEIKSCKDSLDQAIKEKMLYASKIQEIEQARRHVEDEFDHLYKTTEKLIEQPWTYSPRKLSYTPTTYIPTYTPPTYTPSTYYDYEENRRRESIANEKRRRDSIVNENLRKESIVDGNRRRHSIVNENQRRESIVSDNRRKESVVNSNSCFSKIVLPQHIHALDLVDSRNMYTGPWTCDLCRTEYQPTSFDAYSHYPYHCNIDNFDACQYCVGKMEGAVVTDFFTYFK